MRPKDRATANSCANFDPLKTEGQGFIEGNAWNYSLYVPHDPAAMIEMMGGKQKFAAHLDELFTMHLPDSFFAETEDITREGIIGGYIHGNEPSHHVAYLYNWTDQPWKTQERVRMILEHQYHADARRPRRQRRLRPDVGMVSVFGARFLSGRTRLGPIRARKPCDQNRRT